MLTEKFATKRFIKTLYFHRIAIPARGVYRVIILS